MYSSTASGSLRQRFSLSALLYDNIFASIVFSGAPEGAFANQ